MTETYSDFTMTGDSNCDTFDLTITAAVSTLDAAILTPTYPAVDLTAKTIDFLKVDNQYADKVITTTVTAKLPEPFVTITPVEGVFTTTTVSTCQLKSLTVPTTPLDFETLPNNGLIEHVTSPFTFQDTTCTYSYSLMFDSYTPGTHGAATQSFVDISAEMPSTGSPIYKNADNQIKSIWSNVVDDNTLEGVYTIKLTVTTAYTDANPSFVNYYLFQLEVKFNCAIETITSSSVLNMAYTIYAGEETYIVPAFTIDPECSLTYSLLVDGLDPTQTSASSEARSMVTFDPATREITVFSDNNEHGD